MNERQSESTAIDFQLSELIFEGQSKQLTNDDPKYLQSSELLNDAQQIAIKSSFNNQLLLIWGPPGTGKTKTIATVVESHLNAGRTVLLVSHANNAVDEALEDVAEHLKATSFYEEGKLVRLGKPQEGHLKTLEKEYELVLPEKIVERKSAVLAKERAELTVKKDECESMLAKYEAVTQVIDKAKEQAGNILKLKSVLVENERQKQGALQEKELLSRKLKEEEVRLTEAQTAGAIKRLFRGLNPEKIRASMSALKFKLGASENVAKELTNRIGILNISIKEKEREHQETVRAMEAAVHSLNLPLEEIIVAIASMKGKIKTIVERLAEISRRIDELQRKVISEALLIATTLTKTFVSKQFPEAQFDVLVLDEASMAPLPHLYWAAGRCKKQATIVGDFLQLPPICVSKEVIAQKWLGRSIYEVIGVDTVEKAEKCALVNLLNIQYRMAPSISAISNELFYLNKLKDDASTKLLTIDDGLSTAPLVLIDTSKVNPWCSKLSAGGRFNLYSAMVSMTIAKQILAANPSAKVGIATPYKAHARLMNKIARDWELFGHALQISTVHRFQGGEADILIFDTAEGTGIPVAPMLDSTKKPSARLILNVAVTRARSRLYLVGHTSHLLENLHKESVLARLVQYFIKNAEKRESSDIVDNYFEADFEKLANELLISPAADEQQGGASKLYTEKNFWGKFLRDIKATQRQLIIYSPFLTLNRSGRLMDYFQSMVGRGIKLRVYTRPSNDQDGHMADQSESVIKKMKEIGVQITEISKMHQKIALIDKSIAWEGSLNILSHRDTGEQMRRFVGDSCIEEIIKNLELGEDERATTKDADKCPKCGSSLVERFGKHGKFMSCSAYPKCDGKNGSGQSKSDNANSACLKCGKPTIKRKGKNGFFLGCSGYPDCKETRSL